MTSSGAADTLAAAGEAEKPGVSARLAAAVWLVLSLIAILGAAAVLMFALYYASFWIFGKTVVQQAIGSVGAYPVKSMGSAPENVQVRFFILLNALFFCLGVPCVLAALISAKGQWRQRLAMVPLVRKPRTLWLAILFLAMPVYLIGASVAIKYFYPGFTTWFFVPKEPIGLVLSFLAVVIMAPLVEEVLFRGWIYTGLQKAFAASTAVAATALLFAFVHSDGGLLYPLAIFVPALVLTLIRHWTGSVWTSFAAHAAYNGWAWCLVLVLGKDMV